MRDYYIVRITIDGIQFDSGLMLLHTAEKITDTIIQREDGSNPQILFAMSINDDENL